MISPLHQLVGEPSTQNDPPSQTSSVGWIPLGTALGSGSTPSAKSASCKPLFFSLSSTPFESKRSIHTHTYIKRTNYTEPPPDTPYRSTRGSLVSNYLSSNPRVSPSTYLSTLVPTFDADTDIYAGFNLLLFDLFPSDGSDPAARYFSNRLELDALRPSARPAGVDGLSNSVIDQPWEKVKQVRAALDKLLEEEKDIGGEWGDHRWFDNLRDLMRYSSSNSFFFKK